MLDEIVPALSVEPCPNLSHAQIVIGIWERERRDVGLARTDNKQGIEQPRDHKNAAPAAEEQLRNVPAQPLKNAFGHHPTPSKRRLCPSGETLQSKPMIQSVLHNLDPERRTVLFQ